MNNAVSKRNFLLMLSPQEGQDYAKSMGFSTPSEEVVEHESADVLAKWGVFIAFDIYSEIVEAAKWYAEFLDTHGKLSSEMDETVTALSLYAVGLINKLVDSEKLIVTIPEEVEMPIYLDLSDMDDTENEDDE